MNILAFDTETELIADRTYVSRQRSESKDEGDDAGAETKARVHTSPFVVPPVVLGSIYYYEDTISGSLVCEPDVLASHLHRALQGNVHVVGHSLDFDVAVMCKYDPTLRPLFARAAEEGRLHDTKILDVLYGLAVGRYDKPNYNPQTKKWSQEEVRARSLDTIAQHYVGMHLDKDPAIRLTFGQFLGKPLSDVPERWRTYALQDAVATYKVFLELKRRIEAGGWANWLSEPIQVRALLAMRELDSRGVAIDRDLARRLRARFESYQLPLQHTLVAAGLGRWENAEAAKKEKILFKTPVEYGEFARTVPQTGWVYTQVGPVPMVQKVLFYQKHAVRFTASPQFCLNTAAIQAALGEIDLQGEKAPRRADGGLSMEYDYWATRCHEGPLVKWLELQKLQKILSTYLNLYSEADEVYPRWHLLGARSGRMSASGPSIQNVPKQKYGIRALFVPRTGHVFIKADYSAQEMYTLCQVMLNLGIKGALYDTLTKGQEDIHCYAATLCLKRPVTHKKDPARQGQKALNFGVPGGLGPRKLADYAFKNYGVRWTVDEAKAARAAFLEAFPDIREYLDRMKQTQDSVLRNLTGEGRKAWQEVLETNDWNVIKALQNHADPELQKVGHEAERAGTVTLPTGRVRASCRFTEAANTNFQGLASDVTKEAVWLSHNTGQRVVLVVHDEIVIECDEEPSFVRGEQRLLDLCMLEAFRRVCPDLGPYAKVETTVCDRWGPATDPNGKPLDLTTLSA